MSDISLVNVCKTYKNGYSAVKDFSLDIKDRELIIFVGPSGCGKSTTLRMIAGLEEISSGELWIDDCLMNMVEPKNRGLSMVFQNYALYPHMSVYENMAFGLRVNKVPKEEIKKRVHEAAKILEIEHLLDRKPAALSGGQRQRVAIGSVIVRKPKVYLMDEPLSNLDAKLRGQMRVEIAKLHRELDATIIYVTHDQVEAMTLGTRIVVMKDGMIQQAAPPAELYRNPVNRFVAGFIGSPSMNFLNGMVIERSGGLWLAGRGWELPVSGIPARRLRDRGYIGKEITLGIRPEDLSEEGEGGFLEMQVSVREMLGAEVLLHGEILCKPACVQLADAPPHHEGLVDALGIPELSAAYPAADIHGKPACVQREDALPHHEGISDLTVSAKLPPSSKARPGERVRLYVDMAQIKLFDTLSEENILYV